MMDMDLTLLAELVPAGDNPRAAISIIPTPPPAGVGLAYPSLSLSIFTGDRLEANARRA
jgi:hypothetical protein